MLNLVSFLALIFNPKCHCRHVSKRDLASGCLEVAQKQKLEFAATRALLRTKGVDHERCVVVLKIGCVIDVKIYMSQRS